VLPSAVHQTEVQFPYDQYHTKEYLQNEFLETGLLNISLLTLEAKDTVTYLNQSGLEQYLKMFESR
jgi:hypothetical protein